MDRSAFGRFGHDLGEDEFAKALAAAGVLAATGTSVALPLEDLRLHLGWAVQHRWAIVPWESPAPKKVLDRADARALAEAWYSAVVVRQRAPRIEVSLGGRDATPRIDPWLLSTLSLPSVRAGAVYALIDRAPVEVAFNWPLRLGFLDDTTARTFGASIFQAGYFNELIVKVPEDEQPDLLVAPDDLRLVVAASANPQRKADCVLLLGGLGTSREHAPELFKSLRHSIATAGVAVMDVPPAQRVGAALDVVAELAHDHPLDVALFEVGRRYGVEPLLVASRALAEGARLSGFAKRFGREMAALGSDTSLSIPPEAARSAPLEQLQGPADRLGLELVSRSERLDYRREDYAAHDLARMRRAMEPHIGDATRPLRPAPAPRPPRYIQAELRDAEKHRVTRALEPGVAYQLLVNIGPRTRKRVGRAVAGKAVDETRLEPSERGHDLTIVFAEAPDDEPTRDAQVKKLHLPAAGSAKHPCEFVVHPRQGWRVLEGRITVLYKGRVLQTARLLGRVGSGPRRGPLDLQLAVIEVESAARAEASESIDAALVLNDTAAGPTVTSIGGDEAIVTQIAEVKSLAETMSSAIALFTEQDRGEGALPAAKMMELYRAVALPGSQVWKYLAKRFPPRVRTAKRLQVVEAAIGATLPVELFYRQPAPLENAQFCPGGPADGERACSACPDEMGAPKVVCLNQFWGFRTVVERRGLTEDVPAGAVAKLAAARDGYKPPPLKMDAAVFGTSDIVDSAMPPGTPPDLFPTSLAQKALESLVGATNVRVVTGVDEWEIATQAVSPGIIVLLVHKAKVYAGDALQLGAGNPIPQGNILERHLIGPSGIHPIVVLMGCKTGLSKADVLGFVPWLTECGASAVISTLSPVLGRYAGPALATILDVLGEMRGKGTFGAAVLEAKRKLLEGGEPIGMCLVTFGDADLKL